MGNELLALKAIGFTLVGEWNLDGESIAFKLNKFSDARNVLYAFAVGDELKYVGKTVKLLRERMAGYRNPGPTQFTNINNKRNILQNLKQGKPVDIYVLPDNGLMHYGKFHMNLAAGLEDSIVRELSPPWNGGQKKSSDQTLQPSHVNHQISRPN
ncbi:MAG TPA: GIY-YIG nuclease family protein [Gemmataceae bacterium]|jgi:hypothetical protein|nr:GIY-YIG nuclease family protein [Gemmataceae bacterium]